VIVLAAKAEAAAFVATGDEMSNPLVLALKRLNHPDHRLTLDWKSRPRSLADG